MEQSRYPLSESEDRLVAHCLRGDASAWQTLFHHYHPKLLIVIQALTGSGKEQAEEIAAAVWSSLCSEEYSRLRRYRLRSGRLMGYFTALARKEIWRRRRSDRSRYSRECSVARKEATWDEIDRRLSVQEFLGTLTGREREFCLSELLKQTQVTVPAPVSSANAWKLRSRIFKKFQSYFLQENPA